MNIVRAILYAVQSPCGTDVQDLDAASANGMGLVFVGFAGKMPTQFQVWRQTGAGVTFD